MWHNEGSLDHGETGGITRYVELVRVPNWPGPSRVVKHWVLRVFGCCAGAAEQQRGPHFHIHCERCEEKREKPRCQRKGKVVQGYL